MQPPLVILREPFPSHHSKYFLKEAVAGSPSLPPPPPKKNEA